MSSSFYALLVSLVLALPTIQGLKYTVTNDAKETRGGQIFDTVMGEDRARSSLQTATYFIWLRVFDQQTDSERKHVGEIRLLIQPTMTGPVLYINNQEHHEIHLDANYIGRLVPENFQSLVPMDRIGFKDIVIFEINWMLTFGIASVLQWTAEGTIPTALRGGIAGFAVLESHRIPGIWVKAGEGNTWDQRVDVTAQFFYFINKRVDHFVDKLNKKMRTTYADSYFREAAGKTIDEWWEIYMREHNRE